MRRVLIAEDDRNVRSLLADLCEQAGFDVVVCVDGSEAWEHLDRGEQFDLVVTDKDMPKLGGLELLVLSRLFRLDTPFIIISGRGVPAEIELSLANLNVRWLNKPFPIWDFVRILGVGIELGV